MLAATGELADLTEASIGEARVVVFNARRHAVRTGGQLSGRLLASVAVLEQLTDRAGQVVAQTRIRLAGQPVESVSRLVSLHDPDAGRSRGAGWASRWAFGYRAQVIDNADGIVLDHSMYQGNPADAPLLAPAIGLITSLLGLPPKAVCADRGYGESQADADLTTSV